MRQRVNILGLNFDRCSLVDAFRACVERALRGEGGYVCFSNVHLTTEAQDNSQLKQLLNQATLLMPDGMPIVWLSKKLYEKNSLTDRVAGPDFTAYALENAPPELRIAFIGSDESTLTALKQRYPKIIATHSPPFRPFSEENVREDWDALLKKMPNGTAPHWTFVGLGAPKQDFWVASASKQIPGTIFFSVGAAFDFLAGTKARAPTWMQNSGLEWAHRLAHEPGRLGMRYLKTNTHFIFNAFKAILTKHD